MTADTLTANGSPVALPLPFQFAYSEDTYHVVSYAVAPRTDQVDVLSTSVTSTHQVALVLDGYSLDGTKLFETLVAQSSSVSASGQVFGVGVSPGYVLVTYSDDSTRKDYVAMYNVNGVAGGFRGALPGSMDTPATGFDTAFGFHMQWVDLSQTGHPGAYIDYNSDGSASSLVAQGTQVGMPAYADVKVGASELKIVDNTVTVTGQAPVTLPGEPAGAVTWAVAAGLADGVTAAVAWVDSGGGHVSLFNSRTDAFGPVMGLDGSSSLHLAALPDGGFAVSWANGDRTYSGEVFDAAGNGGGVISLAGDVAGVDSQGELFTVGFGDGAYAPYQLQTYTISGSGGGGGGTPGKTFTSDNNGDVWVGTAGDDTFNLGRGGDYVTGNGGDDTYKFAGVPWAGGHITDFNAGDVLNLTGLMSTTSDTGVDGFADGYLEITDDGQGDAQVWANYHLPGNDGWWLVETLDGVSSSSLTHSGDTIAMSATSGGGGGGTGGQTFNSDDNGDTWVGTAGDDTFNLGRGGDTVTGAGGNDTYRFAAVPWAGGHITDFNAGDVLDLSGLMSTTSDTGSDGFADGYLKITDDGSGNAQVWADYFLPGNDGWWLVETLDGVAPSSLTHSGDVIGVGSSSGGGGGGPTSVSTADANYTAPASVTSITLTGSQQHIDASATHGVTITSNDTGNVLIGGAGDDLFHLGRGGDWVAGGAGADTFAYAGTPWAGGGITDFNGAEGDKVDVSSLLQASGYSGSDPFADGYLQLTSDASGNAQLWSDVHQPGNEGWWLVATLDGVSTSSLHYSGGLIT